MVMSPSSFQSCIAKNWMPTCCDQPVGLLAFVILMADWLFLQIGVGSFTASPSLERTDLMRLLFLAAVTW